MGIEHFCILKFLRFLDTNKKQIKTVAMLNGKGLYREGVREMKKIFLMLGMLLFLGACQQEIGPKSVIWDVIEGNNEVRERLLNGEEVKFEGEEGILIFSPYGMLFELFAEAKLLFTEPEFLEFLSLTDEVLGEDFSQNFGWIDAIIETTYELKEGYLLPNIMSDSANLFVDEIITHIDDFQLDKDEFFAILQGRGTFLKEGFYHFGSFTRLGRNVEEYLMLIEDTWFVVQFYSHEFVLAPQLQINPEIDVSVELTSEFEELFWLSFQTEQDAVWSFTPSNWYMDFLDVETGQWFMVHENVASRRLGFDSSVRKGMGMSPYFDLRPDSARNHYSDQFDFSPGIYRLRFLFWEERESFLDPKPAQEYFHHVPFEFIIHGNGEMEVYSG